MKICMLTTVHPPFDTRIFHKESKSLLKAGHSVTIVAPHDSVYKKNVDGIGIVTVKRPGSKILHPITMLRVFIAGLQQDCDIYHCHEPGSLFVCTIVKIIKRKKLIYDVHEHYASVIANNTIFPQILRGVIEKFSFISELMMSRFADYIIVVRTDLKTTFKKVNRNIETILVCPDLSCFPLKEKDMEDLVIYEGIVNIEKRGLDIFLASLAVVSKKVKHIKYLVAGEIPENDLSFSMRYLEENDLTDQFEYTGWVDYEIVFDYLIKAKIGVILLQPIYYNNIMGIPNKLFDYMAVGIPVVVSYFPNITEIVEESKCGLLIDPTDPQKVADAILYLLEHPKEAQKMGTSGRKAVEEKYNWENMEKKLLRVYDGLETIK